MKPKVSVGDRVKVYRGGRAPFKGNVEAVTGDTSIQIIEDGFYSVHEDAPFHPRQLTRLKPRKPKDRGLPITFTDLKRAWDATFYTDAMKSGIYWSEFLRSLGVPQSGKGES